MGFLKNTTRWEAPTLLRLIETALRGRARFGIGTPRRWEVELARGGSWDFKFQIGDLRLGKDEAGGEEPLLRSGGVTPIQG